MIVGGLVAGQGADLAVRADRDRVGVRGARRPHVVQAGPPARARLAAAARRAAEDHRGAAADGRGLLRAPRRRDDPGRPLPRLRAPARAVHRRRRRGCRCGRFLPYDVLGAGRVDGHVLRRSATCSGSRSTSSPPTSRAGCSRSARSSCWSAGSSALVQLRRNPERAREGARLARRAQRPAWLAVRRAGRPAAVARGLTPDRLGRRHGRALRPRALTPGELGLELTTLLALWRSAPSRSSSSATYAFDAGTPASIAWRPTSVRLTSEPLVDVAKRGHAHRLAGGDRADGRARDGDVRRREAALDRCRRRSVAGWR